MKEISLTEHLDELMQEDVFKHGIEDKRLQNISYEEFQEENNKVQESYSQEIKAHDVRMAESLKKAMNDIVALV